MIPVGNFDGIRSELFRNPDYRTLVVLSVENEAELNGLLDMESFLLGIDLILVMPGERSGLRSRARMLRPRYIATYPEEMEDLPLILEAAVKKIER